LKSPLRAVFAASSRSPPRAPLSPGPPHRFVVFGDSLSDPGNAFILIRDVEIRPSRASSRARPTRAARCTSATGRPGIEQLSLIDRALPSAGPALLAPKVFQTTMPSAARVRGPARASTCRCRSPCSFSEVHGLAPADALYVTFFGGQRPARRASSARGGSDRATSVGIIQAAIASYQTNLLTLHAAGARRFLIPNVPDIGLTPRCASRVPRRRRGARAHHGVQRGPGAAPTRPRASARRGHRAPGHFRAGRPGVANPGRSALPT